MIDIFSENITLENEVAKVVPFEVGNSNDLSEICYDNEIWEYMETSITNEFSLQAYLDTALSQRENNEAYPFIVYDKRVGNVAGCTRYGLVDQACQSLEIGWTWYGRDFRGTGINLACKHLLLEYAFEHAGVNRVSFSAAKDNLRSHHAIKKIGGHFEGVLREVFPDADGSFHDLATFSILKSEWPEIKGNIFSEFVG